jgi:hypothetical protein
MTISARGWPLETLPLSRLFEDQRSSRLLPVVLQVPPHEDRRGTATLSSCSFVLPSQPNRHRGGPGDTRSRHDGVGRYADSNGPPHHRISPVVSRREVAPPDPPRHDRVEDATPFFMVIYSAFLAPSSSRRSGGTGSVIFPRGCSAEGGARVRPMIIYIVYA